jgi:hypothetical protein
MDAVRCAFDVASDFVVRPTVALVRSISSGLGRGQFPALRVEQPDNSESQNKRRELFGPL